MMQGDACFLGIRILNNAGSPVTAEDISDVEITIGHLCKTYRAAQLHYDNGIWYFPLTQEETLSFLPHAARAQVRLLWRNGVVEGKPIYGLSFGETASREVL